MRLALSVAIIIFASAIQAAEPAATPPKDKPAKDSTPPKDAPKDTPPATPATAPVSTPDLPPGKEPYEIVTDKDIKEMTFEDSEIDNGVEIPVREGLDHLDDETKKRFNEWVAKIDDWKPANEENVAQRVRNLLNLASIVDVSQGEFEGESAYAIFNRLKNEVAKDKLIKITAWIYMKPDEGKVITSAPDLGFEGKQEEAEIRGRTGAYAKKLLGRLLGKLPKKDN